MFRRLPAAVQPVGLCVAPALASEPACGEFSLPLTAPIPSPERICYWLKSTNTDAVTTKIHQNETLWHFWRNKISYKNMYQKKKSNKNTDIWVFDGKKSSKKYKFLFLQTDFSIFATVFSNKKVMFWFFDGIFFIFTEVLHDFIPPKIQLFVFL